MKDDNSGVQATLAPGERATSKRRLAVTIAGFDPSSGAGITADLKVFSSFGIYGMACPTALTVQSTQGVRAVEPVSVRLVTEVLKTLEDDVNFDGIKIGMLATGEVAGAVSAFLATSGTARERIILDPVLRSSSGRELLDAPGLEVLKAEIMPQIGWITPNLDELAVLIGVERIARQEIPEAARQLRAMASSNQDLNVLVTGGHLEKPDDFVLTAAGESLWLAGDYVETTSTHGTGCALSSALTCRLILGDRPHQAATNAKSYVTSALKAAYPVGKGRGPMHHLFRFDRD